jgi:hypothetical protein
MNTRTGTLAKRHHRSGRQGGSFAILSIPLILMMCIFCALALDLGAMYNRKVELYGIATTVALAAAGELNGTSGGVGTARARAREAAERLIFAYQIPVSWNDDALAFGATPDRSGSWTPATDSSHAETLFYAKVDTARLDGAPGSVRTNFMSITGSELQTVEVSETAIAGRTSVNVAPLAVCAMAADATAPRVNPGLAASELVEFGFRRGVSYDLMRLNPNGTTPARYLVNPVVVPGSASAALLDPAIIGPFACTGSMWIPRVSGGAILVSTLPGASPLGSIHMYLNSRFDDYTGNACSANGAPPDFNVKAYAHDLPNGTAWMHPAIGNVAAAATQERGRLETIADLPVPPSGTTAQAYGPLWAYAKAARYAATMPASGYGTFATSDWPSLYKSGPAASGYPSTSPTPYSASTGATYMAASPANREIAVEQRRVLNVPLLACPVAAGQNVQATVLGVARFFMMVPATSDSLVAEFGGLAPAQTLTGRVELFP